VGTSSCCKPLPSTHVLPTSALQIVVLMHQGFEHYAKGFGGKLQDEWRKVQGRFESVPFVESTEQTLRVIRAALVLTFESRERKLIHSSATALASALHKVGALPRSLDQKQACELSRLLSMHPVSILALPMLCIIALHRAAYAFDTLKPRTFSKSASQPSRSTERRLLDQPSEARIISSTNRIAYGSCHAPPLAEVSTRSSDWGCARRGSAASEGDRPVEHYRSASPAEAAQFCLKRLAKS
jgi:hypothetical protein